VGHLENLQEELRRSFQEFSIVEPITKLVVNPFNAFYVSETVTLIGIIFQDDVEQ
jgi:hypothetical protein